MTKFFDRHILGSITTLLLLAACAAPRPASSSSEAPTIGHAATAPAAPAAPAPAVAKTAEPSVAAPVATQGLATKITNAYAYIDPQHLIDRGLLQTTLNYFTQNKSSFANQNYIAIIDYAKPSSQHRLFIINMHTGQVWGLPVAHGQGSDPARHGLAKFFSDLLGSNASSLGFFRTADTYKGSHGLSLKLDGLSPSNTHSRQRNVVIHGADYVKDGRDVQGRSWGCPAVPMVDRDSVINFLKNGSLLYAGLGSTAQANK